MDGVLSFRYRDDLSLWDRIHPKKRKELRADAIQELARRFVTAVRSEDDSGVHLEFFFSSRANASDTHDLRSLRQAYAAVIYPRWGSVRYEYTERTQQALVDHNRTTGGWSAFSYCFDPVFLVSPHSWGKEALFFFEQNPTDPSTPYYLLNDEGLLPSSLTRNEQRARARRTIAYHEQKLVPFKEALSTMRPGLGRPGFALRQQRRDLDGLKEYVKSRYFR